MNEWATSGRNILTSRPDMGPREKAEMEALVVLAEKAVEKLKVPTFPLTDSQKEALKTKAGELVEDAKDIVVYRVYSLSISQQMEQDDQYFGYVTSATALKDLIIPVSFDVAVFVDENGHAVALPNSNNLSMSRQKERIENDFSKTLEVPGTKAVMLHAPDWTQLDIEHQKQTNQKLIVGFFARTPDKTVDSNVADVGRIFPDDPLGVGDWNRDDGILSVGALPAVVPEAVKI